MSIHQEWIDYMESEFRSMFINTKYRVVQYSEDLRTLELRFDDDVVITPLQTTKLLSLGYMICGVAVISGKTNIEIRAL